ncbi:MAG: TIGR03790 family protein [Candidatus Auribacterota bacterium]|nr:TIGR03790 family protein [Candidatus Auribacterota bacterium]
MRLFLYMVLITISLSAQDGWCLSPPQVVSLTAGNGVIEVNWSAVYGASGYGVYRATAPPSEFALQADTPNTFFRDTNVVIGVTYYYYIISFSGGDYSIESQVVSSSPISTGTLVYNRWSDFIYYFNPWIIHTNGNPSDTHIEEELYLTEGTESLVYQGDSSLDFSASGTPQLTPDRQWLVFSHGVSLRKLSLRTRKTFIIVPEGVESDKGFAVSPDGRFVVYVKKWSGKNAIYICSFDGADERALVQDTKNNRYPSFSPDAGSIVFVSDRIAYKDEIYILNLTTSAITRVTNNTKSERYPRMSPDGTKIAYQAYDSAGNGNEIFSIGTNGTGEFSVTGWTSTNEYFPAWSPDGSKLAFILRNDVTVGENTQYYFHIKMINADGSGTAQFLSDSSYKVIRGGLSWHGKTDVMPPSGVVDLALDSVTDKSIILSFTAPGGDGSLGQAAGYAIVYDEQPFDESNYRERVIRQITVTPASAGSSETVSLDHLKADTTYYICLIASDESGNVSPLSNSVTAQTSVSSDSAPAQAPSNLQVTAHDYLSMRLVWDHSVSSDTAGYRIYRSGVLLAQTPYVNSYIDTVPSKNVSYTYTVSAYDETEYEGALSSGAQAVSKDATIPCAPEWIRVYNFDNKVRIRWEPVGIPDIAGYKIYRNSILIDSVGLTDFYDDFTGETDTTCQYKVSTLDTAGNESAFSEPYAGTKGWPDNKRTLLIINSQSQVSQEIGAYYKAARGIPDENVVTININPAYSISLQNYMTQIRAPIINYLQTNNLTDKIIFLVTTKGVPVAVSLVCVDALLADIYREPPENLSEYVPTISSISESPHSYYLSRNRFSSDYNMLITARIDAPAVDLAKSIVDHAVYGERHRSYISQNTMWLDNRSYAPNLYNALYSQAERFIATCAEPARTASIPYMRDTKEALFPIGSCTDTQFYYGWYSYWNFKDVFAGYLKPGSVAGHLDSASFYNINNTGDNNWGVHLLSRGATIVYGSIYEPYTTAFPVGGIMYSRFLRGFSIGESFWCAANNLGWRVLLVGDPLYNPYAYDETDDATAPIVSNVSANPAGYLAYAVTWTTDEMTEHAVELYIDSTPVHDTGYLGWFSRNAHIVLTGLTENTLYSYKVKSKDISGNETISSFYQFTYADTDDDGIEDNWEILYFGSIGAISGYEDSDGDNFNNFYEFDQGLDPLTKNVFIIEKTSSTTKLKFDVSVDRIYQIYYCDELTGQPLQWIKAGPYRIGMTSSMEWTDDGCNTSPNPQDSSVINRIYKITHTPRSR